MLSLLLSNLANTCTKNTKLTFDLHGIGHTVLVCTVESGQLTTNEYGEGLPSGHETHSTGRCTPYNQVNQLQTEAKSPGLVIWWEWRLINLTLLLLHSMPLQKRCCIHLLTHVHICDLWSLPVSPHGDKTDRQTDRISEHCLLHQPRCKYNS